MASMASSRTGNPCTCSAVIPIPVNKLSVLPSSFGTRAVEYIALHRNSRLKPVSGQLCRFELRRVSTVRHAKLLKLKDLSSGLVQCALNDDFKCGAEGNSKIQKLERSDQSIFTEEPTRTICQKLKQSLATVLIASSFQLTCNEMVLAVEHNFNSLQHKSTHAEMATTSLPSDSSEQFGASLTLDLRPVVRSYPSNSANTSSSQVLAVSSVPDTENASTFSNSSAIEEGLRNPECSTRSTIPTVVDASRDPEPVTNESVVEEAWEVVNENFLDARRHSWSADDWLRKKEDVLKRPLRSRMAAYGAIKGMLGTLNDPYTRFLTPDQFLQLSKYDVTGVGLNIGEVEGNGTTSLRVLGIVLGSPAQTMGVRQGDELVAVNGTSVRGMTAFEASSLIQGPKGTPVSIQIRHGPCEEIQSLTVAREQDVRTPVFYRLERTQNNHQLTGYIRLKEFNALAKRDLVTAMKRLQDAGATSFLLDLQDNPGGLVQAGIEIARLFLDGGETVIQTVGRDPSNYKSIMATGVPLTKAPLMVLVNDHTASASEIVAAALHDNCRAVLVGNRTFGKGSDVGSYGGRHVIYSNFEGLIQSVYELSDGSGIILTVGRYVTPGHVDIDGNGIEPDFRNPPGLPEALDKLASCELKLKNTSSAASNTT